MTCTRRIYAEEIDADAADGGGGADAATAKVEDKDEDEGGETEDFSPEKDSPTASASSATAGVATMEEEEEEAEKTDMVGSSELAGGDDVNRCSGAGGSGDQMEQEQEVTGDDGSSKSPGGETKEAEEAKEEEEENIYWTIMQNTFKEHTKKKAAAAAAGAAKGQQIEPVATDPVAAAAARGEQLVQKHIDEKGEPESGEATDAAAARGAKLVQDYIEKGEKASSLPASLLGGEENERASWTRPPVLTPEQERKFADLAKQKKEMLATLETEGGTVVFPEVAYRHIAPDSVAAAERVTKALAGFSLSAQAMAAFHAGESVHDLLSQIPKPTGEELDARIKALYAAQDFSQPPPGGYPPGFPHPDTIDDSDL
eukprot:COSAG05_NODE_1143_length_5736_cov_9.876885_7_plen_371_part_00